MIFDWHDFYRLAEDLRELETEAARRTAISRLYYAIYWRARIFLENEGFIFRQNDSSHRQIWQEFKNRGRTFLAVSISGSKLHLYRVEADYYPAIEDLDELVEKAFDLAKKIQTYLQQIEKKPENQ
jgi:uncharacterized protein (UPF0332 family)